MDGTNHTSTAGERKVDIMRPISGAALMLPEECIEAYNNMKLRRRYTEIKFCPSLALILLYYPHSTDTST